MLQAYTAEYRIFLMKTKIKIKLMKSYPVQVTEKAKVLEVGQLEDKVLSIMMYLEIG